MKRDIAGTVGVVLALGCTVYGTLRWGTLWLLVAIGLNIGMLLVLACWPRWLHRLATSDNPALTGRLRPADAQRVRELLNGAEPTPEEKARAQKAWEEWPTFPE